MTKCKIGLAGLFLVLFTTACSLSLAADVTPPPSYELPSQQGQVIVATSAPLLPPDIENGKLIYEQKCIECHGPSGMGDGTQASQLPVPAAPIGDFQFASSKAPVEWYEIITNGNIEKFMPGFQSLNDRERWDVAAYALALSMNYDHSATLATFEANCANCHAPGNDLGIVDFLDASALSNLSRNQIAEIIRQGNSAGMPGFGGRFDEQIIAELAFHVRSLGFRNFKSATEKNNEQPALTETILPPIASTEVEGTVDKVFTITGSVANLDNIQPGLVVTLSAFDSMSLVFQQETKVDENGAYRFDDLELVEGRVYQLVTIVDGVEYTSEVLHTPLLDENGEVSLSIAINSTSTDASVLVAERLHVFFDFVGVDKIQVVELYVINNPSDKTIISEGGDLPIISYSIPEGAENLQFEQGSIGARFVKTPSGFGDLQAIDANSTSQVLFAYEMAYPNKLDLSFTMPMPVQAAVFMLPSNSVEIKSDQLIFDGNRSVQGMNIITYSAANLVSQSQLNLQLSGKIKISSEASENSTIGLIVGGSVLLIAIVVAFFWFRSRMIKNKLVPIENEEEDLDALLDAIIALDDSYKNGGIPENAYRSRRAELLAQIKHVQRED